MDFTEPQVTTDEVEEQIFPELDEFIDYMANQPEHQIKPIMKQFVSLLKFWVSLNDQAWHNRSAGEDCSDLQIENKTYFKIINFLEESFIRPKSEEEES